MKTLRFKALVASLALTAPMMVGGQAHAQARAVAVADLEAAVQQSAAYTTANSQIQTTYAAQITAFNTRQTALNAELQPLITAYNTARAAPNATQASVTPSATALQTKQQAVEQELGNLSQPIRLSRAYVVEQIGAQLDAAVTAAMRTRNIDLVLAPQAAIKAQGNADITAAVVTELNRLVPSVQIVPPAGWQPGGQQQQPAPAQQPAQGR